MENDNLLLRSLPPDERHRLDPILTLRPLVLRQVLCAPHQQPPGVFFPLSGVISIVSEAGSEIVEVATVGYEGFVGLPVFLGGVPSSLTVFCQVPGRSLVARSEDFISLMEHLPHLRSLLQRYTQTMMQQMAQSAVCNRVHRLEQRCARWLLMTHDRTHTSPFALTQEFLGQMLGARRPQVNKVARSLQSAGLITYRRGIVNLLDRAGLENVSCECYQLIRREYQRLITS